MSLLFKNACLHDALNPEPRSSDILIKDGRIAALGENLSGDGVDTTLDLEGAHVYPGFVEAHCHLGLSGYGMRYEGSDNNERNDMLAPQLNAIDAFNPLDPSVAMAARAGVTCVGTGPGSANVIGGTFAAIKTMGRQVDKMIVKNPVAMKCAFGENPKFCHESKGLSTRMTTAAKLREILAKAREYEEKLRNAGDDVSKKPAYDQKLQALLPVLRREIPLKAHAHQANDIFTALRIAQEFNLLITLEHCTEGHLIAEELAQTGCQIAVGPSMTNASKVELRNRTFTTPGILAKAGCQVSIITDAPVTPQPHLALCAGMAVKAGMDAFAALQAITINPARMLGVADRVGSIEVGKDADLVITDGCPLDFATNILQVFINGQQVPMTPQQSVE